MQYYLLLCSIFLVSFRTIESADIIKGDTESLGSFTFNVGPSAYAPSTGQFFIGSSQEVQNNVFSVAVAARDAHSFRPLTPAEVNLDTIPNQPNPLHGAAIEHITLVGNLPVIITKAHPARLYLIDSGSETRVFQAEGIRDAVGKLTPKILALASSAADSRESVESNGTRAVFMAVANEKGTFNGNGSGIAIAFLKRFARPEKQTTYFGWDIVNANTGTAQFTQNHEPQKDANRALAVDKATAPLFLGQPLQALTGVSDMYYDRELGRLYVAVRLTTANSPDAGGRCVFVGSVTNGKLTLYPLVADEAISSDDFIIGSRGAEKKLFVDKVRTMQTSTHVRYLVVSRSDQVFALPLVDNIRSAYHGTLADVHGTPLTIFMKEAPQRFQARVFHLPAQMPNNLFTASSIPARVGGEVSLPGPISDMRVSSDAIIVSIAQNGKATQAGIFQSQALFDGQGRIQRWTSWKRVAASNRPISSFAFDSVTAQYWYVPRADRKSVFRTVWDSDSTLNAFIKKEIGSVGVLSYTDIQEDTPGLRQQELSFGIITGDQKLLLVQTAAKNDTFFGPTPRPADPIRLVEGDLKDFSRSSALLMEGGALSDLGPLVTAALFVNQDQGWIVVAGPNGIAILARPDGRGWNAKQGLGSQFSGLNADMSWKKISSLSVIKIISARKRLFVLTQDQVIALEVTPDAIAFNKVSQAILAELSPEQKRQKQSFADLIISGPLGLLATSFGLFRSGDLIDISAATQLSFADWVSIPLEETCGSFEQQGPISQLFALSPTGHETDVAFGGNVWVLQSAHTANQAQIYRLSLNLEDSAVTQNSVVILPDYYIRNVRTFFTVIGDFRHALSTEGSFSAVVRSATASSLPVISLLPPFLKSGERTAGLMRALLPIREKGCRVNPLSFVSGWGTSMATGDFGIKIED